MACFALIWPVVVDWALNIIVSNHLSICVLISETYILCFPSTRRPISCQAFCCSCYVHLYTFFLHWYFVYLFPIMSTMMRVIGEFSLCSVNLLFPIVHNLYLFIFTMELESFWQRAYISFTFPGPKHSTESCLCFCLRLFFLLYKYRSG